MMPQPVKPDTKRLDMRPRLRGKRLEMWNWARWNVMPAKPMITEAYGRALKLVCESENAINARLSIFSKVPAVA